MYTRNFCEPCARRFKKEYPFKVSFWWNAKQECCLKQLRTKAFAISGDFHLQLCAAKFAVALFLWILILLTWNCTAMEWNCYWEAFESRPSVSFLFVLFTLFSFKLLGAKPSLIWVCQLCLLTFCCVHWKKRKGEIPAWSGPVLQTGPYISRLVFDAYRWTPEKTPHPHPCFPEPLFSKWGKTENAQIRKSSSNKINPSFMERNLYLQANFVLTQNIAKLSEVDCWQCSIQLCSRF